MAEANSAPSAVEQLEALSAKLTAAIAEYKAVAETDNDLIQRMTVQQLAKSIVATVKKPEEQWYDQSVWVSSRVHFSCAKLMTFYRWPKWALSYVENY